MGVESQPTPDVIEVVADLKAHETLGPQIEHTLFEPSRPAVYGTLEPPLPGSLSGALEGAGVARLWQHQVDGLGFARGGRDVIVTTPTASGKSLIFQLPVLEAAARGETGRALFLFPLKALGRDQFAKVEELALAADLPADVAVYDGDTTAPRRGRIRQNPPRILITNPDMLHLGMLAHWPSWSTFFAQLEWVVLDELHTYRGIFGSHFHHVLQRLRRICRNLGSEPRIIASSATAANAGEFAATLAGVELDWVRESGAPREGRHFLLLRPASSPYTATLQLLIELLRRGLKTIVFTKARRITELLYSWLQRQEPELAQRVASYRAGFLPTERRRIETDLFEGRLQGVISTSALEMGIDVGGLDACILVGYPGSVMATWQRSGRVGRQERESLTALVALPDALDQYFLTHPEALVGRPFERLVLDPANEPVSRAHLLCAAAEDPLRRREDAAYLAAHAETIAELVGAGELLESEDRTALHSRRRRPHRDVGLRGSGQSYAIVHADRGRVVGTVDGVRVLHECHPGAIYLHGGRQFQVLELLQGERKVMARPVKVEWYTAALAEKETEVLEILDHRRDGPLDAWLGRLRVTEQVVGFERKKIWGGERLDRHELELEPTQFETVGLWWVAPPDLESLLRNEGRHFMGSLHASEHASISLLPLMALCDRGDVGGISIPLHPQVGCGAIFVYDGHPGGVGIARRGFGELPELLGQVEHLLGECDCEEGCPSCVQSPKCGNGNRPLDKEGARRLLRLLLGLDELATSDPWVLLMEREATEEAPEEVTPPDPQRVGEPPSEDSESLSPSVPGAAGDQAHAHLRETGIGTVFFDIETRRSAKEVGGWGQVHQMGVALAVACFMEEDRFRTYYEDDVKELVADLRRARLVVGFNVKRFDYRVLSGYTGADYARLFPTLDLLEEIHRALGYRLSLGHLAETTLGVGKSADGLQSLEWVKEGRLDLVEEYCIKDVEITRDLYLFGRREGYLLYRKKEGGVVRLPVGWE